MKIHCDNKKIETKWYKYWLKKNYFQANNQSKKKPFVMIMPPPNITGALHLGHVLQHTLSDIIARFKRMRGFDVLWLPGIDHAGIQMQSTVEKKLKKEKNTTRQYLGREKFLKYLWQCKDEWYKIQKEQMQKIGESADWSREKFTLDPGPTKAVLEEFFQFFKQEKIYYGSYLVNWCPHCQTALMDLETEYIARQDKLYYLKYFAQNKKNYLTVATARPETLFADTAVAVHPKDPRFKKWLNQKVVLPLTNKTIPVITDESVDKNFGTGALKITPAHSFADYKVGKKHHLEIPAIINREGKMKPESELTPEFIKNLKTIEARQKTIEKLKIKNLLVQEKEYLHNVQVCERCKTEIEPLISEEWFLKMQNLDKPAIQAIEQIEVKFMPKKPRTMALNWLKNIHDWCISRDLWWGHRMPIYYCQGKCSANWLKEKIYKKFEKKTIWARKGLKGVFCSKKTLKKCPYCQAKIKQETKVLDTWFSSGLWPFSALGWPKKNKDLLTYYPSDLMVTAPEILYLWICRMLILGLHFMRQIPFRAVFIHGTLRDEKGQKMSKSLGNGVDPLEMIEKYSADALRFTMARMIKPGKDIKISKQAMDAEIRASRNFMTKIWNIARFILNTDPSSSMPSQFLPVDCWILTKLEKTLESITENLENYQTAKSAERLFNFIWKELADWYIETIKKDLAGKDEKRKKTVAFLLYYLLAQVLTILHPFCPFISEEIWHKMKNQNSMLFLDGQKKDLIISKWSSKINLKIDKAKAKKFAQIKMMIEKKRKKLT